MNRRACVCHKQDISHFFHYDFMYFSHWLMFVFFFCFYFLCSESPKGSDSQQTVQAWSHKQQNCYYDNQQKSQSYAKIKSNCLSRQHNNRRNSFIFNLQVIKQQQWIACKYYFANSFIWLRAVTSCKTNYEFITEHHHLRNRINRKESTEIKTN